VQKLRCYICRSNKKAIENRLKEHKNNIKLDHSKHSVVSEHIFNFNRAFDWENVQILDHEQYI